MPGLVAATVVGLQAIGFALFAVVVLLAAPKGASANKINHEMFSVTTALFAAALVFVARGLWQGSKWSRTAAVVWLVVLLPVAWAMVQAGRVTVGLTLLGMNLLGIVAVAAESRASNGREA
jgi:hypothetical protein